MRWRRGTYLNGLIALSWGLERNYRVYTNIHQLTAFLCGVERLQFAGERSDKRSDQWGAETLLCPVWGVVGGAMSQNEGGASFSGGSGICPSPRALAPPTRAPVHCLSVTEGETQASTATSPITVCSESLSCSETFHWSSLTAATDFASGWSWPRSLQL